MNKSVFKNLLLLFIVLISACSSTKDFNYAISEKKHSVADLKKDIDLTHQILKDAHPGLYWYISKKELDTKFDSLKNSLNEPLTTNQFYQKLAPVVAAVKCGHTALRRPSLVYRDKEEREAAKNRIAVLNQFTYAVTANNTLMVVNNKSTNKLLKTGTEILAIDGNAIGDILNNLEKGFSYDGFNNNPRNKRIEFSLPDLYKIYYSDKDSLLLSYKLPTDTVLHQAFVKVDYKKKKDTNKVRDSLKSRKIEKVVVKKNVDSLKYRGAKVNGQYQLDFKFLDKEKNAGLLTIKSFSIPTANFPLFYKQIFDSLAKAGTQNLVVDIRNNTGGTLNASMGLFAYLTDKDFIYLDKPVKNGAFHRGKYGNTVQKMSYYLTGFNDNSRLYEDEKGIFYSFMKGTTPQKPQKNNFKGKVYVLINEFSFSASSLISANLKGINRAVFVGTETGGGANQCTAGGIPVVPLKHSKLGLRLGINRMAPIYQQEAYGRGVFPDVSIQPTISDRLKNYDSELEWVINDIKKQENVRK